MNAMIVDIMDSVVATLSVATLSQPFAVSRGYAVIRDLESSAEGVEMIVTPPRLSTTVIDQTPRVEFLWVVSVTIQKAGIVDDAEVDGLMSLIEEVVSLFAGKPLASTRARNVGTEPSAVCDPARLDEKKLFYSSIDFVFRVTK